LYYLKQSGFAEEAVGIDIFEDTEKPELYKRVDRFIFGNIEQQVFPEYDKYFDLILLPDVLEHLFEPQKILRQLGNYLKADGRIIVSMPNIRHYSALKRIFLQGDFKYEESGIFDYTHVRFYCRRNMCDLLRDSDYTIVKQESSIVNYKGKSMSKVLNRITFGAFEEFFSYQYFFIAKKNT
ncbi:MAG: methyltransferase domain-containing protein, partial [Flavobacterium sp.]|nr:methyltransferase domain-containing protein [Flavobacterium sp.]